jgi:hypothetical protein
MSSANYDLVCIRQRVGRPACCDSGGQTGQTRGHRRKTALGGLCLRGHGHDPVENIPRSGATGLFAPGSRSGRLFASRTCAPDDAGAGRSRGQSYPARGRDGARRAWLDRQGSRRRRWPRDDYRYNGSIATLTFDPSFSPAAATKAAAGIFSPPSARILNTSRQPPCTAICTL